MKNILVIGSNSPTGANFCAHALELGIEVIATSRSIEAPSVFLAYKWKGKTGLTFEQVDLNHDIKDLRTLITRHRPKHIINFASQSMVAESWKNPSHWIQTNIVANAELLELLRSFDFLERYIHFSTPEVYGNTENWVSEHRNYSPSTPYALSRAAGDMNVALLTQTYGFPAVITRSANVYGEGQKLYRIIPRTLLCCFTGQTLPLQGGGISERSFIHFDDISRALMLIFKQGKNGDDYHISSSQSTSIREVVSMICEITNVSFDNLVEFTEERLGKDQAYFLDATKIYQELGWSPQINMETGLDRCARWCMENLDVLRQLPQVYSHKP